jgi:hypothetical protein
LGSNLALRLVSDIGGEGNIVVFNGFTACRCAIRYDELKKVLKYYPNVKIIQPELCDVIPNTVQDAVTQVTAILAKYPEKGSIKAIWSAWDIPQLGATQALIAAGRTLPTSWQQATPGDEFTRRMFTAIHSMLLDMLAAVARKDYEDRPRTPSARYRQRQGRWGLSRAAEG